MTSVITLTLQLTHAQTAHSQKPSTGSYSTACTKFKAKYKNGTTEIKGNRISDPRFTWLEISWQLLVKIGIDQILVSFYQVLW